MWTSIVIASPVVFVVPSPQMYLLLFFDYEIVAWASVATLWSNKLVRRKGTCEYTKYARLEKAIWIQYTDDDICNIYCTHTLAYYIIHGILDHFWEIAC